MFSRVAAGAFTGFHTCFWWVTFKENHQQDRRLMSRDTTQTAVRNGFAAGLKSRQALLLLTQALIVAGVSNVVPQAGAQGYAVTTVVSDRTARPDGAGTFFPVNPSLDGDVIVFNNGGCVGCASPDSLWAANSTTGGLLKIVSTSTLVPGGSGKFSRFDPGPMARGGAVVFIGYDANSRPGLYAVPTAGGTVVRLADTTTSVPLTSTPKLFTTFAQSGFQHDGKTAVFTGGTAGVTGVYSVKLDGSGLARVADSNTPVNSPSCSSPVITFSKPSISSGNIGFWGQPTTDYGNTFRALYTQRLSNATAACGVSPSAVNSDQVLPIVNPAAHVQTQLDYGRVDGLRLVFRAAENGTGGIFSTGLDMSSAGGALTTIVDNRAPLPGFGAVAFFGNFAFAVDAGDTVFQAHDPAGQKSALFLARSGVVTRIAGTGDTAGSSTIAAVDAPEAGSVQAGAVAFTGTGSDASRAIYLAKPGTATVSVPAIYGVTNAASNRTGAVSPGEIVVVKGAAMGPAALALWSLDTNGHMSNRQAGTQILFDGVPAPLVYVSATQSAAIVPYSLDGRSQTQITVTYQNTSSLPMTVPVTNAAPGLFSADSSGQGQGAILNQDSSYNSQSNPAAAGSTVVLFATGEGQTAPGGVDGQMAGTPIKPLLPVTVAVGGQNAQIAYAGDAPGEVAGMMQINVVLPLGLAPGDILITCSVGGTASQPGLTVAVK
jgi:uncharacterized protein (TIGR03437 family)